MSKVGKLPIIIPNGVEVVLEGSSVRVKGPKGEIVREFPRQVKVTSENGEVLVAAGNSRRAKAMHGTVRSVLANMIKGVSDGWSKIMELVGTGYRAEVQGTTLVLTVGFAIPVRIEAPGGIIFKVEKSDITVEGIDKEVVGEVAAKIRAVRPPEPYQGKGIRYKGEVIKKKAGKAAKAGEGA